MTYFLEKNYCIDLDGNITPSKYAFALVRPCCWSYSKVLDFLTGHGKKNESLVLQGQVAMFNNCNFNCSLHAPTFKTFEEWLIYLNIQKGIFPDFEDTRIYNNNIHGEEYIAKTVDLRTNTVIYDKLEETVQKIKKEQFSNARPFSC